MYQLHLDNTGSTTLELEEKTNNKLFTTDEVQTIIINFISPTNGSRT